MTSDAERGMILVVDDNHDIREFAKAFLERAGFAVATVADGEEGLRYYQAHQSSILLLLTDVMMPNMNGLELADRVLGIDSRLPVLFMSGDAGKTCRGSRYIAKPFRSAELVERVSRMLNPHTHSERTAPAA